MMRVSELRELAVIDPRTARKVGSVSDVQVDPNLGRIAAFDMHAAGGDGVERVSADAVQRVGRSAVMLRPGQRGAPAPDASEDWLDLGTLAGLEVMSEDGNRVGTLADACFDPDTLRIETYEMAVSGMEKWFGNGGRITPDLVTACSRELMLIRAARRTDAVAGGTSESASQPSTSTSTSTSSASSAR